MSKQTDFINLRSTPCPLNVVKCKLALEKISSKDTLLIDLDKGEPEEMVTKALEQMGYQYEIIIDENNCPTCECIEFREKYLGQWEFTKYWGVTHPYEPNSGDEIWIGEIFYGDSDSTLFIPHSPIIDGYEQDIIN